MIIETVDLVYERGEIISRLAKELFKCKTLNEEQINRLIKQ